MKHNNYYYISLLSLSFNLIPTFIPSAQSRTDSSTDYGSLQGILPVIAQYKRNTIKYPTPDPTQPIPITTTPSAPGKYPLVRWLLPGGPPPPAPYLPPLPCNFDTCPIN